ncbi:hypothetical protein MAIT1_04041 [Magnetofaba australis IT-1]|uniref:DUF4197 domain-containing protein n=1 Tax=Magnetofaba australis IT-1 TaxID=1434232 RepID=A0A1Y2K492_9PROT|nr:hypothetical protein MAIT1_04041 [Magnetofaba australis IT-1]
MFGGGANSTDAKPDLEGLTETEMGNGLKAALQLGAKRAIAELGRQGGFSSRPQIRIETPATLKPLVKLLHAIGKEEIEESFVASMNSAAEKAVPAALEIFARAISKMSIADARNLLLGGQDAATQYLQLNARGELEKAFAPIIARHTRQAGVSGAYKSLIGAIRQQGGLAASWIDLDRDLDAYVTEKAVDGLFVMMAQEEARIRTDPAARAGEILQRVFGSSDPS